MSEDFGMTERRLRILAVANQKGGVGKTTTAINFAAALVESGLTVLLVDIDPQGNASTGLGVSSRDRKWTTYDVLFGHAGVDQATVKTESGVDLVPATGDLSSVDLELAGESNRLFLLRDALALVSGSGNGPDVVVIDCPPSLNLLTMNALVASDGILVPLQSEFFALEGLSQLLITIRSVRQTANPRLRIDGVVLTMHDARNNLAQQVEQDARTNLGDLVFSTVIPRNVRISEATSFGISVLRHDTSSKGADSYRRLAEEWLKRARIVRDQGEFA
jgi:chromosome partitioning protein